MSKDADPKSTDAPKRQRKCPVCRDVMRADASTKSSFCSDRCRLIDLQRWFDGDYAIPGLPAVEGTDEEVH